MKILFLRAKKIDFIERENVYLSKAQDSIWFKDDRVSPLEKDDLHSMNVGIEELLTYYCEWYKSDKKKFLIKKVY